MATFAKSSFSANNYYDMARQQRQFPQGKYILRSQKKSPDGQQYGIYLYYYWRGMHVRRSVDMYVAQKDWNQEANGGSNLFIFIKLLYITVFPFYSSKCLLQSFVIKSLQRYFSRSKTA